MPEWSSCGIIKMSVGILLNTLFILLLKWEFGMS